MKKTGKECFEMSCDEDLEKAKREHTMKGTGQVKDLRLAVNVLEVCESSTSSYNKKGVKRKLSVEIKSGKGNNHSAKDQNFLPGTLSPTDSDDEEIYEKFNAKNQPDTKKSKKSLNSEHNNALVELVRHLESKGTKDRYSSRHLTLWASKIANGESTGVYDEPNWDNYLSEVLVVPRAKTHGTPYTHKSQMRNVNNDTTMANMLGLMMIQSQEIAKSNQMFQASLLAALSPQFQTRSFPNSPNLNTPLNWSTPRRQNDLDMSSSSGSVCSAGSSFGPGLRLIDMDVQTVANALLQISMGKHSEKFIDLELDGATLSQLNASDLQQIADIPKLDAAKIIGHLSKLQ